MNQVTTIVQVRTKESVNKSEAMKPISKFTMGEAEIDIYGSVERPLFKAKDVADILGVKNYRDMASRIDLEEKDDVGIADAIGRVQQTTCLTEDGLYEACFQSRSEIAKQFKRVVKNILKELRTKGHVGVPTSFREALLLAAQQQEEIERQQMQIEQDKKELLALASEVASMEKKVTYLDKILACPSTVKVKTIAQDYGMSAIAFNNLLHQYGIQYKCGDVWVLYAKYLPNGYVKDVPFEYTRQNGTTGVNSNMQWTQKGRMFIYEFLKERGILPMIERN